MNDTSLDGLGVLLTRPSAQAGELGTAIREAGGEIYHFPVIEIVARLDEEIHADAAQLPHPDIVIFISANAVQHGFRHAEATTATVAAIGPATRDALLDLGCVVDVMPEGRYDSEHLLAQAALMDVAGKAVRIIRGSPGRELLADTLRERGARVDYVSAYRRQTIRHSDRELRNLQEAWGHGSIDRAVVMSVDTLRKLVSAVPPGCRENLAATPLVTPSERVIQTASELLPETSLQLSAGPGTGDMLRALAASANL